MSLHPRPGAEPWLPRPYWAGVAASPTDVTRQGKAVPSSVPSSRSDRLCLCFLLISVRAACRRSPSEERPLDSVALCVPRQSTLPAGGASYHHVARDAAAHAGIRFRTPIASQRATPARTVSPSWSPSGASRGRSYRSVSTAASRCVTYGRTRAPCGIAPFVTPLSLLRGPWSQVINQTWYEPSDGNVSQGPAGGEDRPNPGHTSGAEPPKSGLVSSRDVRAHWPLQLQRWLHCLDLPC